MKRRILALLLALSALLCLGMGAHAAEDPAWVDLYTLGDPGDPATRILPSEVGAGTVFFLPSSTDLHEVPLCFSFTSDDDMLAVSGSLGFVTIHSGETVDLTAICEEGNYSVILRGISVPPRQVAFVPSAYTASLFLTSADPAEQGRLWVESSYQKEHKATGSMVMVDPDGSVVYHGGLTQIKGRGNTTWLASKKPYQIKLETKTDLLETGSSANRAKTWVLLANYYDPAYLRNTVVLDLAQAMGMDYTPEQRSVALYYDGEYRGLYQLTEKVEVNKGRVNLFDLQGASEDANPDVPDLEALPVGNGVTANGARYIYREGMNSPEDITGGYLLEMDLRGRALAEGSYFCTTRGSYVVVKSPEFASREEMDYIAALYQSMEDAIYNDGVNPDTGHPLSDYLDLRSAAQFYLVQELAKNEDAYASSTYLYKDTNSDVLFMGPLWDFDLCLGNTSMPEANLPGDWVPLYHGMAKALNQLQDFRQLVHDLFYDEMLPILQELNTNGYDALVEALRPSALASQMLWNFTDSDYPQDDRIFQYGSPKDWDTAADYLGSFLRERTAWLEEQLASWADGPAVDTPVFIDVSESAWYYDTVYTAYRLGLMKGTGYGRFYPTALTSRSEPVQVLFNISGDSAPAYAPIYRDVSETAWFTDAVLWATEQGIVNGTPRGYFLPHTSIARQDLITMLYRAVGSPAADQSCLAAFPDAGKVSGYAVPAMSWAVSSGIIQGNSEGRLSPAASTSRAELATIFVRYYGYLSGIEIG